MEEPKYHLEGALRTKDALPEDFDGPLDVILQLLSKNKIEIENVSIAAILEQYLAYLDERKRLDMEIASEFIAMASHLMLIKTKMLLSASEQAEAESELDLLRKSLAERQRKEAFEAIKTASQFLEERNEIGRCLFTKQPEPLPKASGYRYQHEAQDLLRVLAAMTERQGRQLPPPVDNFRGIVGTEPYPVAKKAKELLSRLVLKGVAKLRSLFRNSRSRSEIVATFLAVLELCRTDAVQLEADPTGNDPEIRFLRIPDEIKDEEAV